MTDSTRFWVVRARVASGHIVDAEALVEKEGITNAYVHLELYTAAVHGEQPQQANPQLTKALHILRQGSKEERQLADWLETGSATTEQVTGLNMTPSEKRIVLAAAGLRMPAIREEVFALGKKLNFSPYPPALLLKSVFGEPIPKIIVQDQPASHSATPTLDALKASTRRKTP